MHKIKIKERNELPGTVLTWLTFSSISDMATFFFLSGLSFQYMVMAALLTACSNLLSEDSFLTSCVFSGVMPASRTFKKNPYVIIIKKNMNECFNKSSDYIEIIEGKFSEVLVLSASPHLCFGSSISEVVWQNLSDLVLLPSPTIQQLFGYLSLCLFLLPV